MAVAALAQDMPLPHGSINFNLTDGSPVALVTMNYDQSSAAPRGAGMLIDLHLAVTLRNTGGNRIHGVTLRVVTQEVALGGKGSVTYPSLNVGPGEAFPVRIDMQLMRPTQVAVGPLVQVDLDGVLYNDLGFFGPDRLHSRRSLTAHEMEARRDREYLKRVLAQGGKRALQQEVLAGIARQSESPALNVKLVRSGPAVTSAALPPEHSEQFALLRFPDSPVEPVLGSAQIAGNEVRTPRIDVLNKSGKPVKYVEVGWVLTDPAGRQSIAASLPSADREALPPGQKATLVQDTTLRLFYNGQPTNVSRMTGFVSQVEFADGQVWVPTRRILDDPAMRKAVAPSAEEVRLINLYRTKGLDALVEELSKF